MFRGLPGPFLGRQGRNYSLLFLSIWELEPIISGHQIVLRSFNFSRVHRDLWPLERQVRRVDTDLFFKEFPMKGQILGGGEELIHTQIHRLPRGRDLAAIWPRFGGDAQTRKELHFTRASPGLRS